jgi:hypothetical protein
VVTFIQVSHRVWATYRGVDVFDEDRSADDVVAEIVRLEELDPADYPPGKHGYIFPTLNMILWRGEVSDEPDEHRSAWLEVSSPRKPSTTRRRR